MCSIDIVHNRPRVYWFFWLDGRVVGCREGNPVIYSLCSVQRWADTHTHIYVEMHTQASTNALPRGSRCDIRAQCFLINETIAVSELGWYWVILMPEATSNCAILLQSWKWAVYEKRPRPRLPNYWPKRAFHVCHWHSGFQHRHKSCFKYCVCTFVCVLLGYVGQEWHFEFQINQG